MPVRSRNSFWKSVQRGIRGACLFGFVAALACSDHAPSATGTIAPGHSRFAIAPSFQALPPGVPSVSLSRIQGILIGASGDSTVVSASFVGDSAVLSFDVQFPGTSAVFTLDLSAFDDHDLLAYHAEQRITLRSGNNTGIPAPQLVYAAPDAGLAKLHVAPSSVTLSAGNSTYFAASGTDSTGKTLPSIRLGWSTTDATIATVDAGGTVQAGAFQGTTYVVARSVTGVADSALVTVHAPVDHIVVAPASIQVVKGLSTAVGAELRDSGNHLIDDRAATWVSSDPSVATVSQTGVITGIKLGSATVTASAEGKTASAPVTVVTPVDHIEITPAPLNFTAIRATKLLTAHVVAKSGASVDGIVPQWSSTTPTIATVDATGKVTAVDNGATTITATADGIRSSVAASVQQVASSIRMIPSSAAAVSLGDVVGFTGLAVDSLGTALPSSFVTYASANPAIATVSATGTATARANGIVTIYAQSGAARDSAKFIVAQTPAGIVLSADRSVIQVGETAQLSGHLVDARGNTMSTPAIAWTALTPNFATVSSSGVVTGVAQGGAQFSGAASGFSNTVTVGIGGNGNANGAGFVSGLIVNAATGLPIAGATISGGAGGTSNADGTFSIAGIANGATISFSAPGFVSTQFLNVSVNGATSTQLGSIPLAPQSGLAGAITGQVINATSGTGVSGAIVSFRSGLNATTGTPIATATADANGVYTTQLAPGNYTATASASGFANAMSAIVSIGGSTMTDQNIALVPSSGLRITLTWGANPRDLDSHLFGPTAAGGRFHTWWSSRVGPDGETLDHDDTDGFGPENTTVMNPLTGEYRFYVQHFAGTSNMAASGATVTVTLNGTVIGTFHPPADASERNGDIWEVFSLTNGAITPLNVIVSGNPGTVPEVLNSRRVPSAANAAVGAASGAANSASDLAAMRANAGRKKP